MTAKTMLNKFCDAKYRDQEYKGRPTAGEHKERSSSEMVPPNPYSISYTSNADSEQQLSMGKENKRLTAVSKFNTKLDRRIARRSARDDKKTLFAYKHQEEVYKKLIND